MCRGYSKNLIYTLLVLIMKAGPEAMAAGLPIVTTDVGCVGEVCESDIHALVVPPWDL